jgi:hypothetical protein
MRAVARSKEPHAVTGVRQVCVAYYFQDLDKTDINDLQWLSLRLNKARSSVRDLSLLSPDVSFCLLEVKRMVVFATGLI